MSLTNNVSLLGMCSVRTAALHPLVCPCDGRLPELTEYLSRGMHQGTDTVLETIPKTPAYVLGERVVRPLIDALASLCDRIWKTVKWVGSFFGGIGSKNAETQSLQKSVVVVVRNESCPVMTTWLDFSELMCANGGGITISPMKSDHMRPERGVVVALRGFSKIVPAKDFCSRGRGRVIVEEYVKENADTLSEHLLSTKAKAYEPYFGAWYNRENEKVYLDVSVVFREEDVEKALCFARGQDQIAVYHISQGREIPAGGTGES